MLAHGILSAVSKGYIDAIAAAGPVAFWPLTQNTKDLFGANDLNGSASFSNAELVHGFEKSVNNTGSLDLRANYAHFALQTFSIEFIFASSSTTNLVMLENNQNAGFSIQTNNSGGSELIAIFNNPTSSVILHSGPFNFTSAAHIVATKNSSGLAQFYVNGSLKSSVSNAGAPTYSSTSYLNVGSRAGTIGFVGNMAGLSFYNRELTAQDVLNHYNAWRS